jgi:Putative metallopeptidase
MNRMNRAAATVFAVLAFIGLAAPAMSQQSQVKIAYEPPTEPQLRPIYEQLKQRAVLEELQYFLTPLRLPRPITVRTAQCGATTLPYTPQGPATICYEMVAAIGQIAAAHTQDQQLRQTVILGAFIETALHETANAIFDVLQVPIWGREGDAADRLAALIMTQFGEEVAQTAIVGTAQLFMWSDKRWTGSDFAVADSPDYQRFFNYVCIAYAAAPLQFGGLVDDGLLPKRRARRCGDEYGQIRKAFDLRIMPYVDPDLLIKVRSTPWLNWTPAKQ